MLKKQQDRKINKYVNIINLENLQFWDFSGPGRGCSLLIINHKLKENEHTATYTAVVIREMTK